jgi:hypothetical protein
MLGASEPLGVLLALTNRPAGVPLALSALAALAATFLLRRVIVQTAPPRPTPVGNSRPAPPDTKRLEPPAVVAMLTNGYDVPACAVGATALDLARRGWIRTASTGDELVVFTHGEAREGDALRSFELQVLNHLVAGSFDGVLSGPTIEAAQHRLSSRWWQRFRRDVANTAHDLGLTEPRYTPEILALPGLAAAAGLVFALVAWAAGDDTAAVRDSITERALWAIAVVALVTICWHLWIRWRGSASIPTENGMHRADEWMGYRSRLRAGIPAQASVITAPEQQLALAHGFVMGLAPHVADQFPVAPEDHHHAWSEAGGSPHVVDVRYPLRPGYGRNPPFVAAAGAVVLVASVLAQRALRRVADGEALTSIVDNFPDQADLVERAAGIIAVALWLPLIWAVWAIIAGLVDTVWTIERVGAVVRVRRPTDVVPAPRLLRPLAERDRFAVFMAIDDGRRRSVSAWLANERSAAPQGAVARVRATPLLGYVRSSEPVGASTAKRTS